MNSVTFNFASWQNVRWGEALNISGPEFPTSSYKRLMWHIYNLLEVSNFIGLLLYLANP
jgi:hypothetical protein